MSFLHSVCSSMDG